MADLVLGMIDDVIIAFETENLEAIKDFSSRDDVVDAMWHSIFREMLTFMMENPKNHHPQHVLHHGGPVS